MDTKIDNDMTYRNRYILKITIFLTALLAGGNAMAQVHVHGNVYGGGNLADVKTNTEVNMSSGSVDGNVFGGGKGSDDNYLCDKAMVGVMNAGAGQDPTTVENKDKGTKVTITGGTVGTLNNGTLVDNTGNVYGGGKIGRVEWNTQVTIGVENQTEGAYTPVIYGSVFGAGAGNETHGFAALVRGNSTVIIQGKAKVQENVYGGGEMATAGRYWVKGIDNHPVSGETQPTAPGDDVLPSGMPYATRGGGVCTVTVQDNAQIGPDAGASATAGHVFGAGKGVNPHYSYSAEDLEHSSRRMADTGEWEYFTDDSQDVPAATRKTGNDKYLQFLQTLALATETHVNIGGNTTVKGSVYGGSENGFVQDDTDVEIQGGTIGTTTYGHVFGGGKGLEEFAEAGKVKGNTEVAISAGSINGNVYGGGELGYVGSFTVTADGRNYTWQEINSVATGKSTVIISGGTIGSEDNSTADHVSGHVFGAGKGSNENFKCDKAMLKETSVTISDGTVYGNVYGGGQIGRVDQNAVVKIGNGEGTDGGAAAPDIKGSVFGAGAGVETHGYSALVRGNTDVTVEGNAKVGKSVYGGGEIAAVGKYGLDDNNMPNTLLGGGECKVIVKGYAEVGPDNGGGVFGAGEGVVPHYYPGGTDSYESTSLMPKRMTTRETADDIAKYPEGASNWSWKDEANHLIWEYLDTRTKYLEFLQTLALATDTKLTIDGHAKVYGSVYGGSKSGFVQRYTDVKIQGDCEIFTTTGTGGVVEDGNVFGGGKGLTGNDAAGRVRGDITLYILGGTMHGSVYGGGALAKSNTLSSTSGTPAVTTWPTSTVNLFGGTISGDAYGSGLGDATTAADAGNTKVNLNGMAPSEYDGLAAGDFKTYLGTILTPVYNSDSGENSGSGEGQGEGSGQGESSGQGEGSGEGESGGSSSSSTLKYYLASGKGCVVNRVFGANNTNGTPLGNVDVHVYGTQHVDKDVITSKYTIPTDKGANETPKQYLDRLISLTVSSVTEGVTTYMTGVTESVIAAAQTVYENSNATEAQINEAIDNVKQELLSRYEVKAVFGGGNLADYTADTGKANVIIETCYASIESVYGGGNAAAVPETDVLVKGAYEIGYVFGGGNGASTASFANPGANVGLSTYGNTTFGTGNATTLLKGGYIHEAYGGSNSKGTISGNVSINKSSGGDCLLTVDDLYGAGKDADIEGDLIMVMGCSQTRTKSIYGCSKNANVKGNVELTITSGEYGKVFGGNNESGAIFGHIIVNIEETGCSPIIIDELYGCGNNAPYSVYGYYHAQKYVKTESGEEKLFLDAGMTIPLYKDGDNYYKNEAKTIPLYIGDDNKLYINEEKNKPLYMPRTSADNDGNVPVSFPDINQKTVLTLDQTTGKYSQYDDPVVNIISCTRIGKVFGGGLGSGATVYGNPIVNINQIYGTPNGSVSTSLGAIGDGYTENNQTVEGGVFGGGNQAAVYGNATVNIATEPTVKLHLSVDEDGNYTRSEDQTILGARITGNVYGGGNLADVGDTELGTDNDGNTIDVINLASNTFVNICAVRGDEIESTGRYNYTPVTFAANAVTISGSVFGGGRGEAAGDHTTTTALAGAFRCGKAMVTGNTNVAIGNGTVSGSVYGGGMVGRVEGNTTVSIGFGSGVDPITSSSSITSAPVISQDVFGAGKGVNTHGYSALVRGETTVTVAGNAQITQNIYGGGEIASTGRYKVAQSDQEARDHDVEKGMPYVLDDSQYPRSGYATVTVKGYAEVGRDDMQMKKAGGPDDLGYVFGAGKGILPYEETNGHPGRIFIDDTWESYSGSANETKYLKYIETLSLTTQTYVTIDEHAFIKGSVYGGSENGHVQRDTYVYIKGYCQIGNGWDETANSNAGGGVNHRYAEADFINPATARAEQIAAKAAILHECAHWDYGVTVDKDNDGEPDEDSDGNVIKVYLPYDKYLVTTEASTTASDGHTFFGNVFGGGSGLYPYKRENNTYEWLRSAGRVYGNTNVEITGGHILTSVYGGCELTDVGNGLSVESNKGRCFVKMSGGTLGVPRTLAQIAAHPVTCYLFGAGKGDQRTHFNQWTNVGNAIVEINDSVSQPIIYGSVFGGGEDGHVLGNVNIHIKKINGRDPIIGTWGTSYVEGNVFGAGRGFGGDALTAGVVSGNVNLKIEAGQMLGSIYGGGRIGSVGTYLVPSDHDDYGKLLPDGKTQTIGDGTVTLDTDANVKHGKITINISGGTIGNRWEYKNVPVTTTPAQLANWKAANYIPNTDISLYKEVVETTGNTTTTTYLYRLNHTKGGNVFAGCMGRLYALDGRTPLNDWTDLGKARSTELTITGGTIKSCVYGGAELGTVGEVVSTTGEGGSTVNTLVGGTEINISGSNTVIGTEIKNSDNATQYTFGSVFGGGYGSTIEQIFVNKTTANPTGTETNPKFTAGLLHGSTRIVMENGAVKGSIYGGGEVASVEGSTNVTVSGGTVGVEGFGGDKMGNVYGGGSGDPDIVRCGKIFQNTNVTISGNDTRIWHNVYGGGAYGTVGDFDYEVDTQTSKVTDINGLLTTGTGVTRVTITGGTIGYDGRNNGMVFGSSRGDIAAPGERDDFTAWVYDTHVTIGTSGQGTTLRTPLIKGSVYGSGENGHTFNNTDVKIYSGTIGITSGYDITYTENGQTVTKGGADYPYRGNVYGGGCGTDKYYSNHEEEIHDGNGQLYNALAGIVYGNTNVTITGGHIVRNVYGAGAMGSVGHITSSTPNESVDNGFGLSWPYKFEYALDATSTEQNTVYTGKTTIDISGDARIGCGGTDDGNVFGAARGSADVGEYGITEQRYEEALLANVRETEVKVRYDTTPTNLSVASSTGTGACITGSVFGGGEDGHVYENAKIEITGGLIGHSVYGGGKGKGTYPGKLKEITGNHAEYETDVASWIAGKIYGNTWVKMTGGHVIRNVYGGGNLGSVGKGNYAGGAGDYYPAGYGERITTALSENTDFMGSGKAKVEILGGTVGTADGEEAGLATGNVFGSSRGRTAADVGALSPRYEYAPDFFLGYCNETEVIIGTEATGTVGGTDYVAASGPTIYGSVYGGGRDGHVRRETKVTINEGTIGVPYTDTTALDLATTTTQWRDRGNVYGSGSGLGTYETKVLKSGAAGTSATDYVTFTRHGTSSGSVTDFTTVDIKGGTIYQNVYGGGALSSVGPPRLGQTEDPQKTITLCKVTIEGGQIGTENGWTQGYGGSVYGASRGGGLYTFSSEEVPQGSVPANESADKYATTCYTEVNMNGGTVWGDVYGGGEAGIVKHDTDVNLMGGVIKHDAYGGGRGITTIAANVGNVTVDLNGTTTGSQSGGYTGTPIGGVDSNENTAKGCVVGRVFGCNNVNGTPKGSVLVYVHATQRAGAANVAAKTAATKNSNGEYDFKSFDVEAVYGGGNLAAYEPTKAITGTAAEKEEAKTVVIIDGCYLTSIGQVYGGGNAASVSATDVTVNGAKEIGEVFGGGNGKDDVSYDSGVTIKPNPGANVGYRNYSEHYQDGTVWKVRDMAAYDTKEEREAATDPETGIVYGTGKTQVTIYGGNVHAVYGGSNTKGNVRVASVALLDGETNQSCDFNVDEAYGGGKNADMDGTATLIMNCIQGMKEVYGGAEDADVLDNVELNITNGTFDQVFGGNNKGGRVAGSITVNIEETGCQPVIIGELYGGGNLAGYSIYGYKQVNDKWEPRTSANDEGTGPNTPYASPVVNVKSFTGIGNVFGGGYGQGAVMVADPTVNINVVKGRFSDKTSAERFTVKGYVLEDDPNNSGKKRYSKTIGGNTVYVPEHEENTIGAIYNVFGGGNAAEVIGTPHVNIGTLTGEVISLVSKPIEDSEGKTPSQDGWTPSYEIRTVEGVDIRGNVFGGGNEAAVTGDTKVVIGKNDAVKTYSFTSFDAASGGNVWSSGLAQTTGETKNGLAEVVILTNGKYGDFVGQKYYVSPNATANGTARTELMDASGNGTSLYVAIKSFEQKKTYSFTSWSASTGGTEYSSGTAAPTGNFKIFNNKEYMQIEVLTNGEASWVGRTFYVPVTLGTGETRYRLHNAEGNAENVWVTITE